MVGTIRWSQGDMSRLGPWDGRAAAMVWVGSLVGMSADGEPPPPNDTDILDAAALAERLRSHFLLRRLLLRRCVARWTDTPADAVVIGHDLFRRPVVRQPPGPWRVSTASRDGLVAVALAEHSIGVDLEVVHPGCIAPAALAAAEKAWLAGLPETERDAAFFGLWTAKEAYLKAIGLGLARDPVRLTISPERDGSLGIGDDGTLVRVTAAQGRSSTFGTVSISVACVVL